MNERTAPAATETDVGDDIYALATKLFPICRSITGEGVRETLDLLSRHIDLKQHEVASGTAAFDWTVPREWVIREAWIKGPDGATVVDFRKNNLHVISYSMPVRARMPLASLKMHLHTLPDQPALIPYRTSYYAEQWGFCMAHDAMTALPEGEYEVFIDSELKPGALSYGEFYKLGASDREVLLYTHCCHPSLANDNCSGMALLATLARHLQGRRTRYGYRIVFGPGTIGSLVWLSRNEDRVFRIDHGLVVSCVGDSGGPTYKRSRRGNAFIDRAMAHVLKHAGHEDSMQDFSPYGYDERQFCSPGFNLPVGLFQRSAFGTFPEYHTSADNLDFIHPDRLADSFRIIAEVIDIIEGNWIPLNLSPKGEPQLGRRGLYAAMGGDKSSGLNAMALLWVLNFADGQHDLLAIADRAGMPFARIAAAAEILRAHDLLADAEAGKDHSAGCHTLF